MSIPLGLVDAWLRPQPGPQPGPVDCGNALWELVEGINAEFGLELDMDSLLSGADGGSSLAALAESVGSALGLQPKPEPEPERRTCPVDLPLERPAADGPPHELAAWRPGQSESDTWQVEEAFRRGQVAMIRVLPTLEMRLAAARATLLAATNAYLPRGLMRAQETPLNDNRRLEVILLEHIEGGGKTPINDTVSGCLHNLRGMALSYAFRWSRPIETPWQTSL